MQTLQFPTWADFVRRSLEYLVPFESQVIYRGQAKSDWTLQATLDRARPGGFANDEERAQYQAQLLADFRREAIGLEHFSQRESPEGEALELLARHHGLPSMILDWTRSPFVAAFFAFSGSLDETTEHVAVYGLPIESLAGTVAEHDIAVVDNPKSLWTNVRAVEQRSVFMRVQTSKPIDQMLADVLFKLELPATEAPTALRSLRAMGIDARSLFRNLDGAARCVRDWHRISQSGGTQ